MIICCTDHRGVKCGYAEMRHLKDQAGIGSSTDEDEIDQVRKGEEIC